MMIDDKNLENVNGGSSFDDVTVSYSDCCENFVLKGADGAEHCCEYCQYLTRAMGSMDYHKGICSLKAKGALGLL